MKPKHEQPTQDFEFDREHQHQDDEVMKLGGIDGAAIDSMK